MTIGAKSRIRNAIIDEGVVVPEGAVVGYGNDLGRFSVSPGGVIVIDRGYQFHATTEEPITIRVPDRGDDNGTSVTSTERLPVAALQN